MSKYESYSVKEIVTSALKGFSNLNNDYAFRTVFFNETSDMSNAEMFDGVFVKEKTFYQLKVTCKRDRVELPSLSSVIPEGLNEREDLALNFHHYILRHYAILRSHYNGTKLILRMPMNDYEISFVKKVKIKF